MYETGPLTAALSWQWMDSVREAYSKYSVQPGETYIPAVSKQIQRVRVLEYYVTTTLGMRGIVQLHFRNDEMRLMGGVQVL